MKRISKKLKNFFKKRKQKLGKKSHRKKRKIIASLVIAGSFAFGVPKIGSAKIQNYQTPTIVVQERVIPEPNEALNLEDDRQIILVDSNTPGTPTRSGSGPSDFPEPEKEQSQESNTPIKDSTLKSKKNKNKQCKSEEEGKDVNEIYILPDSGPVKPDNDSTVPVESIMSTYPGLKTQYTKLQKNEKATKQASTLIKKLANGSLKIGSKDVRKIHTVKKKKIYEAKSKDVRVYFRMKGKTVEIIAPCLKTDQKSSIKLLDPKTHD